MDDKKRCGRERKHRCGERKGEHWCAHGPEPLFACPVWADPDPELAVRKSMALRLSFIVLSIWTVLSLLLDLIILLPQQMGGLGCPEESRWRILSCSSASSGQVARPYWKPLSPLRTLPTAGQTDKTRGKIGVGAERLNSTGAGLRDGAGSKLLANLSFESVSGDQELHHLTPKYRYEQDDAGRTINLHLEVQRKRQEFFQSLLKMLKYPKVKSQLHSSLYSVKTLHHTLSVYLLAGMEPSYVCQTQERYGKLGDGGKVLCDSFRVLSNDCMVYSYGSRLDCSFELDLQRHYPSCTVHVFDPSPSVASRYNNSHCASSTTFHSFGLGGYKTEKVIENRTVPLRTLSKARAALKHSSFQLSVLKMDIEGDEFDAIQEMCDSQSLRNISILLLEVHTRDLHGSRVQKMEQFLQFFTNVEQSGFILYHKELNWIHGQANAEFSFIHRSALPNWLSAILPKVSPLAAL